MEEVFSNLLKCLKSCRPGGSVTSSTPAKGESLLESAGVGKAVALVLKGNNYKCILFGDGSSLFFSLHLML